MSFGLRFVMALILGALTADMFSLRGREEDKLRIEGLKPGRQVCLIEPMLLPVALARGVVRRGACVWLRKISASHRTRYRSCCISKPAPSIPVAMTVSPGMRSVESPMETEGKFFAPLRRSTAMSKSGSAPTTSAE